MDGKLNGIVRNSWGFALFCDDIRAELGGKFSIMGVYQNDMVFPSNAEFPILYPKFCILVKYYEVRDYFTDDIVVRIFLPGDPKEAPSVTMPFQRAILGGPTPVYPLEEDQEALFNLTAPFTLSPFPVKQEGFVKVRIVCGSTTTAIGSLMVRRARPDENIQIPGFPPPPAPPLSA
jgi:hypothetical protein